MTQSASHEDKAGSSGSAVKLSPELADGCRAEKGNKWSEAVRSLLKENGERVQDG